MRNIIEKIKLYQDSLFLIIAIMLVGFIGFGLGRLSTKYQTPNLNINSTLINTADLSKIVTQDEFKTKPAKSMPIKPVSDQANFSANVPLGPNSTSSREVVVQKVVGNKQSKIYHLENCPGALKMKEENKIYFNSVGEAQNAGYRPAGNCAGLQ